MTLPRFSRPTASKALFAFALFLSFSLSGCRPTPSQSAGKSSANNAANSVQKSSPAPEANLYIDDVMLSRPYAVIGGTVQNIGSGRLEDLSVEIELRRRDDDNLVKREVSIEPNDLAPGEKGKFSLKVFSEEWSGSRVLSLRSGTRQEEVAFKSLPGAKRPPEKLPINVINTNPARKRSKSDGEEFLNTPDTPIRVP